MPALPTGSILLWHGSIAKIPTGYVLCNGDNGTPDLRDRFLVGAGNSYAVDDTGGASTHDHDFTSDGHSHFLTGGPVIGPGANYNDQTDTQAVSGTTDTENHLPPYYALCYIMKT